MALLCVRTTFPSVLQHQDFLKLKAPRAALLLSPAHLYKQPLVLFLPSLSGGWTAGIQLTKFPALVSVGSYN